MGGPADDVGDFLSIFDRYYQPIYAYLHRRLPEQVAKDVASEVFVQALAGRATFDATRGSVAGWLYGIATNLIRRHHRDEQRRMRAYVRYGADAIPIANEVADEFAAATARADQSGQRHALGIALAELVAEHRDVLLLSAWTDLTYPQIAEALNVPVGTVRSRLSRAKKHMRELLKRSGQVTAEESQKDATWTE
jgi:RNA polymerase sigma-70 factor (ECF subfamily)